MHLFLIVRALETAIPSETWETWRTGMRMCSARLDLTCVWTSRQCKWVAGCHGYSPNANVGIASSRQADGMTAVAFISDGALANGNSANLA